MNKYFIVIVLLIIIGACEKSDNNFLKLEMETYYGVFDNFIENPVKIIPVIGKRTRWTFIKVPVIYSEEFKFSDSVYVLFEIKDNMLVLDTILTSTPNVTINNNYWIKGTFFGCDDKENFCRVSFRLGVTNENYTITEQEELKRKIIEAYFVPSENRELEYKHLKVINVIDEKPIMIK